jgi:hypothetical protein
MGLVWEFRNFHCGSFLVAVRHPEPPQIPARHTWGLWVYPQPSDTAAGGSYERHGDSVSLSSLTFQSKIAAKLGISFLLELATANLAKLIMR